MRRVLLWIGVTIGTLFVLFLVLGIGFVKLHRCRYQRRNRRYSGVVEPASPTPAPPQATSTTQPTPTPTVIPTPTPLPVATPEPTAVSTPTFEESLRDLTLCERVRAKKSMGWGQAPGVVGSDDPRVTGRIEAGDYVRFLTPPNADGLVRVKVYPHDGRPVGRTDDMVWINWGSLELFRLDRDMFSCEN